VKELVVLVADIDMENAIRGLIERHASLGIRPLRKDKDFDIHRHLQRDPGCRGDAEKFLKSFVGSHRFALVIFDYIGCGREHTGMSAKQIEGEVKSRLSAAGWSERCAVVVIEPELEAWVWNDSPHVADELGWKGRRKALIDWLEQNGFLAKGSSKPSEPKSAMLKAMRSAGEPLSPRVFSKLAEKVSLSRCKDRAFLDLKDTLRTWFPCDSTVAAFESPQSTKNYKESAHG
jgi:hypothetical protein